MLSVTYPMLDSSYKEEYCYTKENKKIIDNKTIKPFENNKLILPIDKPMWRDDRLLFAEKKLPLSPFELDVGQILDYKQEIFNRGITSFCRNDLDWVDLGKYMQENFKSLDNVDIQCFGCSTGQEAYSLAMLLKNCFNDAQFTIKASDIVHDRIITCIRKQESGVFLDEYDFRRIYYGLGLDIEQAKKYFNRTKSHNLLELSKSIVDSVVFGQKNILKSIDELDSSRKSIIFCRNMWPYIGADNYLVFAKKLYDKLAPGSVVVIGVYDCVGEAFLSNSDKFPNALKNSGFKPVKNRGLGFEADKNMVLIFKKE